MIRCRTLGPIWIEIDGQPAPPELLWRKHLALLLYLARSPKGIRSREHLLGLFWPDKPEGAARHSLNVALHVLRQAAGDDGVDSRARDIRLAGDAVSLDVDELDRHTSAGNWAAAAALSGGEFCDGLAIANASEFEDWLTTERALWRGRQIDALVQHADELEQSGQLAEATQFSERARALDPTSERAARSLMRNLALRGNRQAAIECFENLRRELERVGVEPDAETRALADRFRSGQRVSTTGSAPEIPAATTSRRLPLAGRGRELRKLLDLLADSRSRSHAVLVVIEGAPGLGRSRLLEEIAERACLAGTSVVRARAVPTDQEDPGNGVLALGRGGLLDAPGIAAAPPAALAVFAERLTDWGDRFRRLPKGRTMSLGPALAEILRMAADERPVLLIVDDAEWLDPETYGVMEALLRDLASSRLAIAMSVAAGRSPVQLDLLRARIGRDIMGEVLRLEALDGDQVAELVAKMLPDLTPDQRARLARRVLADSAGLPLFIVELLHAVAAGLDLEGFEGWPAPFHTLDHTRPGDLPDAIVAAIRIGFRRLSANAQQVLAAAALLGERMQPGQLAWVAKLDTEQVSTALDELEWSRWLVADPRGYGFVARIVREVIGRDMLTPGQRQRIVERAAQWPPSDKRPA